jgi:hypothetical protein|tara:strand:- start:311 stop:1243 length:933 start_codon:yes stop_codon:yes gene_type:complete
MRNPNLRSLRFFLFVVLTSLAATANVAAQDLPVIGITSIKAPVNDNSYFSRKDAKAENFQTMLETQMSQVGRFKIIERNRVDEVLAEQGLNNTVGDGKTAGGGYNVTGIDYLVYGAITKLGSKRKEMSTGSFSTASIITEFSVDIKVVDASTGEVRKAETVSVQSKTASGIRTGSFSSGDGAADPLSDIQRIAAKKVAGLIATSIFPIEVVKGGAVIYLNYGSAILDVGDIVSAYRPGEDLIDEATGINLGSEEELEGDLEITFANTKFSKAKLLTGNQPSKGSIIRIKTKVTENSTAAGKPGPKRGRKI